jgi:bifunctional DNA-binding transcriptional regulator/antitoxin component of YhaV-PrlF toxin-antitoxin module
MKLQKVYAYKYGNKEHYKYLVTLPLETVEKLGWVEGGELETSVQGKKLVLRYVGKEEPKEASESKMSYEEFRNAIKDELKKSPEGLTWTEIRDRLKLPQKVPNNKWVRRMEADIGLNRVKDLRGIVWRVQ